MMLELAAMLLLGAAGRAAAASEAGEGAVTDAVRQMYEKHPFPSHEPPLERTLRGRRHS